MTQTFYLVAIELSQRPTGLSTKSRELATSLRQSRKVMTMFYATSLPVGVMTMERPTSCWVMHLTGRLDDRFSTSLGLVCMQLPPAESSTNACTRRRFSSLVERAMFFAKGSPYGLTGTTCEQMLTTTHNRLARSPDHLSPFLEDGSKLAYRPTRVREETERYIPFSPLLSSHSSRTSSPLGSLSVAR